MSYLQKSDLYTNMYPEVIDEITRANESNPPAMYGDAIVNDAINVAIQEAKSYLSRYDLVQLFGSADGSVAPTLVDYNLQRKVKDIVCWHLLALCNTNIDMTLFEMKYNRSIEYLKDIQKGLVNPDGWPYIDTTNETAPQGDAIDVQYFPKRNNNF
ncbi:MAG TPA: phage protein Gp36 family protein [Flavipsychrobacter sp.]|nr:phage protein Gp36 family protein [Flavipsychrobacter sp.]